LGITIIIGSLFVKTPQIIKILMKKSTEGISLLSCLLNLLAITIYMSYAFVSQFPFSAWGDATFRAVQSAFIVALIFYFGHKSMQQAVSFVIFYIICILLMCGITPLKFLWVAQGFNMPLLFCGITYQAYINYKNKSTGQLSAISSFMLFSGGLSRIFTSIQETGDAMLISTHCVYAFAIGIIVFQIIYYWKRKPKSTIQATEEEKPLNNVISS
jgi:mannose-P-dolichol utilization defect 1